ncbi:MAG TPA: hypothetical protein VGQ83_41865 [Polyangia bacterium]|jgi:hypothetical protein
MIPPAVMYFLGAVLAVWGAYRVYLGRRATKGRGSHLVFGVIYVAMGLFLVLTTARVIPAPNFGGRRPPPRAPSTVPFVRLPRPPATQPRAASQPGPATGPASRPAPATPTIGPAPASAPAK